LILLHCRLVRCEFISSFKPFVAACLCIASEKTFFLLAGACAGKLQATKDKAGVSQR
jgi:hypothetical protein